MVEFDTSIAAASFESMLRPVLGPAYGFAVTLTGDRTEAEDLLQDAVLLATTPGGEFAEIDTIVGGTGAFEGATGKIVATGTSSGPVAEGSFVGEVCWD